MLDETSEELRMRVLMNCATHKIMEVLANVHMDAKTTKLSYTDAVLILEKTIDELKNIQLDLSRFEVKH